VTGDGLSAGGASCAVAVLTGIGTFAPAPLRSCPQRGKVVIAANAKART
jgi:hypothetical protein